MAGASGDELFDFGDGADTAAGTDGGAIECSGGAGEFELARRGPVLEKRVDEGGVKNVTGTGRVRDMDIEGRRIKELGTVEGEDAVVAERGGGKFVGEFFLDELQRFWEVGFARDAAGNVIAGNQVIDPGQ